MNHTLLNFYLCAGADHRGRTLAEMTRQDDLWMELTHDFIQWWFPLLDLSWASVNAPLLDPQTIRAFETDPDLRRHLKAAVGRFLRFLGLQFDGMRLAIAAN